MNIKRRKYQNEHNEITKENARIIYQEARTRYRREITLAKKTAWQKVVEDTNSNNAYGLVYRWCRGKVNMGSLTTSIKMKTGYTCTWEDTMRVLLEELFGDDDDDDNVTQHHSFIDIQEETFASEAWTNTKVKQAVNTLKNKKTPGIDYIEAEMVKVAMQTSIQIPITRLYNACLDLGYFPEKWKQGNIRVLLKNKEKDPTDARSYRPICLLSVLSKVLERLIRWSKEPQILHPTYMSSRQYGYRKDRSTEDAIVEVRTTVKNSDEAMVLALLFDITGAFDNLKWSTITKELQKRRCHPQILKLINSYLSRRTAIIIDGNEKVEKTITKGCPRRVA